MIIKTIEEFRRGVPMSVTASVDALLPTLAATERRHLLPILGRAQYATLVAAYDARALTDLQSQLLAILQTAVANLAYATYLPLAQLQIDDAGIRIASDENLKTAFQWQIDDLRELLQETGYAAIEDALALLDENKASFPDWSKSAAYTYNKELLLNSAADFDRDYSIAGSRRTFLALVPIMRREEHFSLEPVLSAEFCAALRAEIQTGTVSPATTSVLQLLHPALANFTASEAVGELGVDLAAGGLVVKELDRTTTNSRVRRQASDVILSLKRQQALETGRAYLRDLVSLLNAKASATVYPAFFASSCYTPPAPPVDPNVTPAPPKKGGLYRAS